MNAEQKAEKDRLQLLYGELMAQTFKNMIALHRWHRVEQRDGPLEPGSIQAKGKRLLQEAVAKVLQQSDPGNKAKLKAFSAWLASADLSSHDQLILEDWEREVKRRGEIRGSIVYG